MTRPSFSRICNAGHKAVQIIASVIGFALVGALLIERMCQGVC